MFVVTTANAGYPADGLLREGSHADLGWHPHGKSGGWLDASAIVLLKTGLWCRGFSDSSVAINEGVWWSTLVSVVGVRHQLGRCRRLCPEQGEGCDVIEAHLNGVVDSRQRCIHMMCTVVGPWFGAACHTGNPQGSVLGDQ